MASSYEIGKLCDFNRAEPDLDCYYVQCPDCSYETHVLMVKHILCKEKNKLRRFDLH